MSLSASVLSAAMRSGLLSANIGLIDGAPLTAMCDAISTAVVNEIKNHAVVTIITAVATGVTAGAATAPVTGTGTVG